MNCQKKIAIFTYNTPHKKTFDTLCLLKICGYKNVIVFAFPLSYEKKSRPFVNHRPNMSYLVPDTRDICNAFGYQYIEVNDFAQVEDNCVYLVCGSGLISQEFVNSHQIINSHPGYIPKARGLDALKWAIFEGAPIGVTTHFLGEEVDAGEVIERRELKVDPRESFFELGLRVYRTEIDMLVQALEKLDESHEVIGADDNPLHRRMPISLERKMLQKYQSIQERVKCSLEI